MRSSLDRTAELVADHVDPGSIALDGCPLPRLAAVSAAIVPYPGRLEALGYRRGRLEKIFGEMGETAPGD